MADENEKVCKDCNDTKCVNIPCPDKKPGCIVNHIGPCPTCTTPSIKSDTRPRPALEVNGPANIVTMVDDWRWDGEKTDVENMVRLGKLVGRIRANAYRTIEYMKQRETQDPKFWHEIKEV